MNLQAMYMMMWEEKKKLQRTIQQPLNQILDIIKLIIIEVLLKVIYRLGRTLDDLQKIEEAIQDYTKAIELFPQYHQAYYNRGIIWFYLGSALGELDKNDEAIKDYTQAIQLNPQYYQAFNNRGNAYKEQKKIDKAIKDYTQAIQINPDFDQAYYNRGIAFDDLGKKEEAIKDYTKALQLNSQHTSAFYNRGKANYDLGKIEEAIKDYTKAIELTPTYHQAYYTRGIAYKDRGRKEEAVQDYLKAAELSQNNPLYLSQLGNFYYTQNDKAKAKNYFFQAEKHLHALSDKALAFLKLTKGNIIYIKSKIHLINQIEEEIEKAYRLVRSSTLTQHLQLELETRLEEKQQQFVQEIIKPIKENSNVDNMQLILEEIKTMRQEYDKKLEEQQNEIERLKEKQRVMEQNLQELYSQEQNTIQKELNLLSENKNQQLYYQSLYWRLQSYLTACLQISTDLFTTNNDAAIETRSEQVAQIIAKVGKVALNAVPVPFAATAFNIINEALEYYKERKFRQRIQRIVNVIKMKAPGLLELEIEIKFSVISLTKQLPPNLKEESQTKLQQILVYFKQIAEIDYNSGIKAAHDPYWIKGIEDTIVILHYLEDNSGVIQDESEKKLRIIITDAIAETSIFDDKKSPQQKQSIFNQPDSDSADYCHCQIQ